jgi:tetratricopeptide (TPR) repeat protein
MSSKPPIVKQVAWISVVPQVIFMGVLILIGYMIEIRSPILFGAITYLIISILLRRLVPRSHRQGIKLFKNKDYEKAINYFKESYDFFNRHIWLDKYRFLILLSSSRISYKEMALLNMAFCNGQIGRGDEALKYYERTLSEFPDSEMAKASINMFNTAKNT